MSPTVSIILPAYNTGKYICKCIESIQKQTFGDWELIIVDDGSTDDTLDVSERITEGDNRIKVIRTENRGVSAARNECICRAVGKYLCFIDSDDTIEPEFLMELVKCAEVNNADIAQCSYVMVYEDGSRRPNADGKSAVYRSRDEIIRAYFNGKSGDIRIGSWAKLLRRDRFDSVRFDERLKVYEDALYIYQCCCIADTVVSTELMLYNYLQRSGSVMNSRLPNNYRDYFTVFDKQYDDFRNDRSLRERIAERTADTALWLMRILISAGKENELWELRNAALERYFTVLFSSTSFAIKIKLTFLAIMPHLYFAMLKRR